MEEMQLQNCEQPQAVIICNEANKTNGMGTAGFVLSIVAVFVGWIPIVGWVFGGLLWLLGLIFSILGIFRSPRGLAMAGFIISLASIVFLLLTVAGIVSLAVLNS